MISLIVMYFLQIKALNTLEELMVYLGEPSDKIFGQTWDFVPTRGGVSPNPNFLTKLTKT